MPSVDQRIGPTAHYTAYAWHRLALPHADAFVTPAGRAMFWALRASGEWLTAAVPGQPRLIDYLEMRHRTIDAELIQRSPDRIVEIGAGLSRRGITWARGHDVDYIEVDLPHMSRAKAAALSRAGLHHKKLHLEARDVLATDFPEWLRATLQNAERPVVVAEGLLEYFEAKQRRGLLTAIAGSLPRGGALLCELRDRYRGDATATGRLGAQVLSLGIEALTRGRGLAPAFESSLQIEKCMVECGFRDAELVSLEAVSHLAHLRFPGRVWCATR